MKMPDVGEVKAANVQQLTAQQVAAMDMEEYEELQNLNGAMLKTSVCRHWSRGHCKFGSDCGFAHGGTELRKPLKTALCRHYEGGKCRKGNMCGFAHGAEELGTAQPELLTIDSQEPLDPHAAKLPAEGEDVGSDKILVLSCKKKVWRCCSIIASEPTRLKVHYDGYSPQFDEWISKSSDRLADPVCSSSEELSVGCKVVVLSKRKRIWRQCTVLEADETSVKVHYDGYNDLFDESIERSSDRLRYYTERKVQGRKMSGSSQESLTPPHSLADTPRSSGAIVMPVAPQHNKKRAKKLKNAKSSAARGAKLPLGSRSVSPEATNPEPAVGRVTPEEDDDSVSVTISVPECTFTHTSYLSSPASVFRHDPYSFTPSSPLHY